MKSQFRNLISTGDNNFVEVIKHSIWAMAVLIGATGLQFIFDLLLTRTFKADGAGIFYLCFSILMITALIGRLGLDRVIVRFVPPMLAKNKIADARGVKRASTQLVLYITIPLAIVIFSFAGFIARDIFNEPRIEQYLRIFAFAIPVFSLNYINGGFLRASKRTREALTVERVLVYGMGILSILILGNLYGLKGMVVGFVAGCFIASAIGFKLATRHLTRSDINLFSKKKLLMPALPLLFVAFASQLNGQASVLILGSFGNSADVGVFNIALKISMLMTLILTAINVINATKISELYTSNKKKQLELLLSKTSALGTAMAIPLFLLMFLFPQFLLSLFGNEFTTGSSALMILAVGQLINVSVGSTFYTLAMTGQEKALAGAVGASMIVNVILGLIFIPLLDVVGAGIVTAITIGLNNILLLILVRYRLGIWTLPFKSLRVWVNKVV